MSSHREAPEISKDPVADSTDVYAFVSPDQPDTVTLIANFIPLQKPDGGPNFYEFGDDVLYEIHDLQHGQRRRPTSSTSSGSTPRSATRRRSSTTPARSTASPTPTWNRPQFYSVTRVENGQHDGRSARTCACPPVNVGTAQHAGLRARSPSQAVHTLGAAARCSPASGPTRFHVDLGSIFDLGALRPFNEAHLIPIAERWTASTRCRPSTCTRIALQVPITRPHPQRQPAHRPDATRRRSSASGPRRAAASRGSSTRTTGKYVGHGPWEQVSRLGNPLFNEVIVPMAREGRVERPAAAATTGATRSTSTSPSWPGCCRCSTRACSRTWRRTPSRGPT